MSIEQVLHRLRHDNDFMRNVTAWREVPPRAGNFHPIPSSLDARLTRALQQRGIDQLYSHQAQATEASTRGENVVVVTGTASGKTLCYNLPVLNALLDEPAARALYLFPTKALAQDQLAELTEFVQLVDGEKSAQISVAAYDGDTPSSHRRAVRTSARIILSNPDMLHASILPHHLQWAHWFAHLRFVVIDELHAYRGVFGSHFANVLRRLRRICQFYGGAPQFIATSATIANPRELAERLVEAPVHVVNEDGSPSGARHVILYNPPIVDRDLGLRKSSVAEAERITGEFLADDVQTIVFARSRLTTELLVTYLRHRWDRLRGTLTTWKSPQPAANAVRGYRGGYLPQERRDIEAGLRDGRVRAVVATNALELGINIGQLDASVMVGFPGTIASTWQQAGRAGRRKGTAAAVLVAGGGGLDQYVISHPRYFFERSPEHAHIHPDNLVILLNHLQCAVFELPFTTDENFGHVSNTQVLLEFLAQRGVLHRSGNQWHWMNERAPVQSVSLRAVSGDTVTIVLDGSVAEETRGLPDSDRVIGVLDRFSVPILAHEGAIYLHEGQSYSVTRLDWDGGKAYVRPSSFDYYTEAQTSTTVTVQRELNSEPVGLTLRAHGDVTVTSKATTYRKVRLFTQETLGLGVIDLPEQSLDTTAYWISFPDEALDSLRADGLWWSDSIEDYGPNWPAQRNLARARDGYRCVVCKAPESPTRQHDVHHIQPFRTFGYVPGRNDAYLTANRLENLTTLCRNCHRRAEAVVHMRSGLGGLAYALSNVAPLHLMCDPRDLGMTYDPKSPHNGLPTITLYDRVPGGIGFSEKLYEFHRVLLMAARELATACGCTNGCPACVGPAPETSEAPMNTRRLTLALLDVALA